MEGWGWPSPKHDLNFQKTDLKNLNPYLEVIRVLPDFILAAKKPDKSNFNLELKDSDAPELSISSQANNEMEQHDYNKSRKEFWKLPH